jgi:hypothetical protein
MRRTAVLDLATGNCYRGARALAREGSFMHKRLVVACVLASAAGCYKATFLRDPSVMRASVHDRWTDFFFFGLVGEQVIDVNDFCPGGRIAEVQTGGNFGTGIIYALTLGIYTPRKVYVRCAADDRGRTSGLELFGDRDGRLVAAVGYAGGRAVPAKIAPGARPGSWHLSFEEDPP